MNKSNGSDSYIKKAKLDIKAIQNSIIDERKIRILSFNDKRWINGLSKNKIILFEGNDTNHRLLTVGIVAGDKYGQWETTDTKAPYKNYIFHLDLNKSVLFKYDNKNGTFDCLTYNKEESEKICKKLLEFEDNGFNFLSTFVVK